MKKRTECMRVLAEWFRSHPGVTQRSIAKAVGLSEPEFSMLMHGARYPSVRYARRLSRLLEIPVEKLVNPRFVLVVPTVEKVA